MLMALRTAKAAGSYIAGPDWNFLMLFSSMILFSWYTMPIYLGNININICSIKIKLNTNNSGKLR